MNNDDIDAELGGIDPPHPERIAHQRELKIPLLSYRRSSRAGLWLLVLPGIYAVIWTLKHEAALSSPFLDALQRFYAAVDHHPVFTYSIPLIFAGLPLLAMVINLLAICHFLYVRDEKEFLITVKIRPLNIALFLLSFAVLVFFLLPDRL